MKEITINFICNSIKKMFKNNFLNFILQPTLATANKKVFLKFCGYLALIGDNVDLIITLRCLAR